MDIGIYLLSLSEKKLLKLPFLLDDKLIIQNNNLFKLSNTNKLEQIDQELNSKIIFSFFLSYKDPVFKIYDKVKKILYEENNNLYLYDFELNNEKKLINFDVTNKKLPEIEFLNF